MSCNQFRLAPPLVSATMVVGDLGASGQRVDGDDRVDNLINRSPVIPDPKAGLVAVSLGD
jgi:hypothetical protein